MPQANFFSGRLFYQLLGNVGSEVLLFLVSEFFARFIFPSASKRTEQLKFLVIQNCILAVVTLLVYIFHHTPFLLVTLTFFVFLRLLLIYLIPTSDEAQLNGHVSKPLRKSLSTESVVPVQWYSSDGEMNYHPQVCLPQSRMGSLVQQRFTPARHQQQTQHTSRAANPCDSTWKGTSAYVGTNTSMTTQHSTHRVSVQPKQAGPSTELSREPLKATHMPVGGATYSHSYMQYLSSYWSHSNPSRCPPGISNSGNICFVNSTLQTLTWTPGFLEALKKESTINVEETSTKQGLLEALFSVLDNCHVLPDGSTSFGAVSSSLFLKSASELVPYLVAPPRGTQRQSQQDASEFLLWLLDNLQSHNNAASGSKSSNDIFTVAERTKEECLHKLKTANSYKISTYSKHITELAKSDWILQSNKSSCLAQKFFLGQIVEARECQNCQKMSVNVEYFTVLPLPIPETGSGQYSLLDCFACFSNVEELNSSNMMVCPCTTVGGIDNDELILTPGVRLAMLSRLPKRLILQLSRFSYNTTLHAVQKKSTPITLPMQIDISPHLMESKLHTTRTGTAKYKLYALCIHTGAQSTSYGHYLAYCQASNDRWYCFNDSSVTQVDNIELELQTATVLQNAYLLFYTT